MPEDLINTHHDMLFPNPGILNDTEGYRYEDPILLQHKVILRELKTGESHPFTLFVPIILHRFD